MLVDRAHNTDLLYKGLKKNKTKKNLCRLKEYDLLSIVLINPSSPVFLDAEKKSCLRFCSLKDALNKSVPQSRLEVR